jgi:hypothetical protein
MRGSILDIFFWGVLALSIIFGAYVYMGVTTITTAACNSAGAAMGANANATSACNQPSIAATNFANTIPFVIGVGGLGVIAMAAFLPVSPIFLPLGIILLLVAVVIYYNIQSALPSVFNNSFFVPLTTTIPLPAYIAQNIAWLVLVFGAGILIVMYGRIRNTGGTPEG